MKTALITGITGQDGSHLTELLLAKGYTVHGLIRRASTFHTQRIEHLYQDPHDTETRVVLHYGDLSDSSQLTNLFYEVRPDEVYHLGAQSHVQVSEGRVRYSRGMPNKAVPGQHRGSTLLQATRRNTLRGCG